jgi:hypothetical protein
MIRERTSSTNRRRLQSQAAATTEPQYRSRITPTSFTYDHSSIRSDRRTRRVKVRVVWVLAAFSSILVLALTASATTSRYIRPEVTIRGLATDTSAKPLAGATVVLQTFDGRITSTTTTDRTGQFAFESRGRRDLIIVVNKPGYNTAALSVPQDREASITVTMELQSSGSAAGGGM